MKRCRVCGLEDVPFYRRKYCSEVCKRRAQYLRRKLGQDTGDTGAARRAA